VGAAAYRIPHGRSAGNVQRAASGAARRVALCATWLVLLGAAPIACASSHHPSDNEPAVPGRGHTRVRVENQRYLDMDIYAVYQSQRIRLGTVSGGSSQVFELPRQFVNPGMPIQFLASPIGGAAMPISEEVTVNPGDEINLVIAPY
jgi:hypothetical protein